MKNESWKAVLRINSTFKKLSYDRGLIVALLYRFFGWMRLGTFTFWWLNWARLNEKSKLRQKERMWSQDKYKTTPPWQDRAVIIIMVFSAAVFVWGFWGNDTGVISPVYFAIWILLDIICYNANMVWFDDLDMELEWNWVKDKQQKSVETKVWSYRRIFFQVSINIFESVLMFAVLHRILAATPRPFFVSFSTATTFSLPKQLENLQGTEWSYYLWYSQIVLSFFLVMVVFAVVVSQTSAHRKQVTK